VRGREVRPGLLVWLLGVSAWLSWAPFEWNEAKLRFQLLPALNQELIAHFFLLVPFAVGLSAMRAVRVQPLSRPLLQSSERRDRTLGQDAAVLALMATFLEVGQLFVHSRSVSPVDWLATLGGAVVAAAVTRKILKEAPRDLPALLVVVLMTGLACTSFFWAILPSRGLQLESWNPDFSVVTGDELGGGRRYLGTVSSPAIRVGHESNNVVLVPGASREDRYRAVGLAERTQSVTLQAHLLSFSDTQRGPARIVTFSQGHFVRNATLAQEKRDLVLRLRTSRGGKNGASFEFILREAVQAGKPTWVSAEFRRGVVTMRSESAAGIVSGTFRPDFLRVSLKIRGENFPKLHPAFSGRGTLVQILLALAGVGYLLGCKWPRRAVPALLGALALTVGLTGLVDVILLRIPLPGASDLALLSTATVVGVALTRIDRAWAVRVPQESLLLVDRVRKAVGRRLPWVSARKRRNMKACPACKRRGAAREMGGSWASILRIFRVRKFRCDGCGRAYIAVGKGVIERPGVQPQGKQPQPPKDSSKLQEVIQRVREAEAELKSKYESSEEPDDRRRNRTSLNYRLNPVQPATYNGDREPEAELVHDLREPRLRIRK